jgi:hypothetical protein
MPFILTMATGLLADDAIPSGVIMAAGEILDILGI